MKSTFFSPKFLFSRLFCLIPFFLILLFEWFKQDSNKMNTWVMGFVAPVEQFLGRICSRIPFLSIAECITAVAIISFLVFLVNTVVSLIHTRTFLFLLKRMGFLVCVLAWLWAAFCWMWNAVYYIPSLTQRCGLSATPHSVEELTQVTAYFAYQAGTLASQMPRDTDGHFEKKLEEHGGNLKRAAVDLAQMWRSDKGMRSLEALMIVADREDLLVVSGNGEVIVPDQDFIAIGSGGNFAYSAANALFNHTDMGAEEIVRESLKIASSICVYTNDNITIEKL